MINLESLEKRVEEIEKRNILNIFFKPIPG